MTIALIPLIGMVGLAADIGHAYYGQRALQASADAAARAAKLPDTAQAISTAKQYGTTKGAKNAGNNDSNCTKLKNARAGMLTLLGSLDPVFDRVALVALPPATSTGSACSTPPDDVYDSKSAAWLLVSLTGQYQLPNHALDNNSKLVKTVNCLPASGPTAYANAIEAAQAELDKNGRSKVGHYIVFFTDGAANTGPTYFAKTSPYRQQPCHQGVTSASQAKAKGTIVYAIGYTLSGIGGASNRCQAQSPSGPDESPSITAFQALQQIASDSTTFFNQPALASLNGIFSTVAAQITGPRLIPDTTP